MTSTLDFIFENFNTDGIIRNVPSEISSKAINDYLFGKKTKKTRKIKDPNAPKRPTSSYMIWLNSNRDDIKNKYFSDIDTIDEWDIDTKIEYYSSKDLKEPLKEGKPKLVALVTSKAGIIWKSMSDEDKLPYETQFKEQRQKYNQLKADYRPEIVVEGNKDIPEDWDGPHYNRMIDKTIKDDDGKTIKLFKSFNDAISKANELGMQCYGITETKTGYSVRIGSLKSCDKSVASWTKKDFVKPIKEKKKSKSKVSNETKKKMDKIFDESSDSDNSANEESDADEMEVQEVSVDGKTYYHDENTNKLYDPDSEECIGKYINGKIVV